MYAWVTSVKRVIINLYLNGSIIYLFHKLRSQRRCMFFPQCNIQYLRLLYVFVTGQAALSKTIHFGHGFYSAVPLQRLMIRDRKPISQRMSGLGCTILFSWDVTPSRNLLLVLSNVCIGLPPNTVRPRLSSSLGYVFFFFFLYSLNPAFTNQGVGYVCFAHSKQKLVDIFMVFSAKFLAERRNAEPLANMGRFEK